MIPEADIEAMKARLTAATPGPWIHTEGIAFKDYVGSENGDLYFSMQRMHPEDGRDVPAWENAELIAACPTDLAALLDEREELRGLLAEARDHMEWDFMPEPLEDTGREALMARIDAALGTP